MSSLARVYFGLRCPKRIEATLLTEVERTVSFGKLHLKGIVASVGLTAGLLVLILPLPELESSARIQLALTLGALSFWASGVMPAPITGMLYMGLLLITNSSDPLTVFSGWTNEGGSLWLVLCAFLIASGVEKSGLARRVALSICASGQVKGFQSLIAAIAVIVTISPLLLRHSKHRCYSVP
ncbi:sodium:sulfate symporter, partial [Clostridium butyricum]|nr:sodium:sulfate symporter [Gordonibacter pamelaeae]MZI83223.1 sodium:sulfate symporter [Clostridium butyricum]